VFLPQDDSIEVQACRLATLLSAVIFKEGLHLAVQLLCLEISFSGLIHLFSLLLLQAKKTVPLGDLLQPDEVSVNSRTAWILGCGLALVPNPSPFRILCEVSPLSLLSPLVPPSFHQDGEFQSSSAGLLKLGLAQPVCTLPPFGTF